MRGTGRAVRCGLVAGTIRVLVVQRTIQVP